MNTTITAIQKTDDLSSRNLAIIAGVGLLLMAILAPVANFSILEELIVPEDAAKTFSNIVSSKGLFRVGICLFLIVALLDIIVAWSLYVFLKPINKSLSLLTAWLRIVYAAMLGFLLIFLINVLHLVSGADYLTPFNTHQLQGMVMLSLASFKQGWEFSLIIFGFHLFLLGYLMLKAGYMRMILGILLIIASLGYMIDGFGKLLSSHYHISIGIFTFIGEIVLIFWLLIAGGKIRIVGK
jgi:hypothetical protein